MYVGYLTAADLRNFFNSSERPSDAVTNYKVENAFLTGPGETTKHFESDSNNGEDSHDWIAFTTHELVYVKEVHVYFKPEHLYTAHVST